MTRQKCKKYCDKPHYESVFVFFGKEYICTFARLSVRSSEPRDHDLRRRRSQRPLTAAMVNSLPPRRVDSIDNMHERKSSRVDGQKR